KPNANKKQSRNPIEKIKISKETHLPIDIQSGTTLLQVFDMPTSLRFYREILEFELIEGTDDWVYLRRGNVELMLNTAYESDERPPRPDPTRIAAHDDTGIFFGCPDVDAAYEHIKSKGWQADPPKIVSYGMKQLYIHDPDGYNLCFQWPSKEND